MGKRFSQGFRPTSMFLSGGEVTGHLIILATLMTAAALTFRCGSIFRDTE